MEARSLGRRDDRRAARLYSVTAKRVDIGSRSAAPAAARSQRTIRRDPRLPCGSFSPAAISSIVEIGFAGPNAADVKLGGRTPRRLRCACISSTLLFLSVGLDCRRRSIRTRGGLSNPDVPPTFLLRVYCRLIGRAVRRRASDVTTRRISNRGYDSRRRSYNWLARHLIDVVAMFPARFAGCPPVRRSQYTLSCLARRPSSVVIFYYNRQTCFCRISIGRRTDDGVIITDYFGGRVEHSVRCVCVCVCVRTMTFEGTKDL